jgi:hypothetical protein
MKSDQLSSWLRYFSVSCAVLIRFTIFCFLFEHQHSEQNDEPAAKTIHSGEDQVDNTSKNKYQVFADQLLEHCRKCKSKNADKCSETNHVCHEFEALANQLRYDLLHPHNPCGRCIVRPTCSWENLCDDFKHFCNMRRVAMCQLTGKVILFAANKKYLWMGPRPDEVDLKIAQIEDLDGNYVDLKFTEKYIRVIKNDPLYKEILEGEREFIEYQSIREG